MAGQNHFLIMQEATPQEAIHIKTQISQIHINVEISEISSSTLHF